ncbi:uncharacterized protein LOC106878077 isoform X3 [Octopus bimaculoides]|uniref:uncharacterized protein LOC106878077 isoform X3 n=1 Tax=Octopus bimaculoides TaxID=37653 RepID=UPI0022DF6E15|nr:uncharacterized protein LOC106878077 isoform X3 [Octopus bimaculoides]
MAAEDNEITLSTEQPTRYNIGPITAKSTVRIWGRFRTFSGLTATEWLFLSMSLINIVIAICLTIYQLVKAVSEKHYVDIIFTILILINAGFCVFYTIHGLLRERAYELLALVAAMIVIFIYCIVQASVNKNLETVKLVRLIIASILVPLNIGLATLVVRRFGWLEFKIVGASEALQNMYKQATLFSTLLKFDLQVTMKKESKIGVLVFILVGFLKPGYYLFKTITLYIHLSNLPSNSNDLTEKFMIYCILTSVTIALFVWALLMIELFFVQRNFNKGLKERVLGSMPTERTGLLSAHSYQAVRLYQ